MAVVGRGFYLRPVPSACSREKCCALAAGPSRVRMQTPKSASQRGREARTLYRARCVLQAAFWLGRRLLFMCGVWCSGGGCQKPRLFLNADRFGVSSVVPRQSPWLLLLGDVSQRSGFKRRTFERSTPSPSRSPWEVLLVNEVLLDAK